jgi:hypothetical protein
MEKEVVMRAFAALVVLALAVTLLAGCSGTSGLLAMSGTGTFTSSSPTLPDGSSIHLVIITATRNGLIMVSMENDGASGVNDPYLAVADIATMNVTTFWGTTWFLEANDTATTHDAFGVFRAVKGHQYTVGFNTHGSGDYGTYKWNIGEVAGSRNMPAMLVDANAAAISAAKHGLK